MLNYIRNVQSFVETETDSLQKHDYKTIGQITSLPSTGCPKMSIGYFDMLVEIYILDFQYTRDGRF